MKIVLLYCVCRLEKLWSGLTVMIMINVNIIPCTLSLTTQSDTRGIFIYLHFSYCFHVCSTFERIYELLIVELASAGKTQQLSCVNLVCADYKTSFEIFTKTFSFINLMESAKNKASRLIASVPQYLIKILISDDLRKLSTLNVTLSYHKWQIIALRLDRHSLKRGSPFSFLSLSMKIIFILRRMFVLFFR